VHGITAVLATIDRRVDRAAAQPTNPG
jgi:hypothetical protein